MKATEKTARKKTAAKESSIAGLRATCKQCYYCMPALNPDLGACGVKPGEIGYDEDGHQVPQTPLVDLDRWSCMYFVPRN